MTAHTIAVDTLLGLLVITCWIGAAGMWRMREPIQALHYVSLPASLGIIVLAIVVCLEEGNSQTTWKTLLIAVIVLAFNAVVGHATGRAFRVRELGHWEPLKGDPVEMISETERK